MIKVLQYLFMLQLHKFDDMFFIKLKVDISKYLDVS